MESPSHLESFLNELKASGQSQGQGHFTVAREKALEKLAEFQLPFQGAWIVKVVQAVVAFGVATPIAIGQTRRVTSIKFAGKPPCALADLEAAFFNPDPTGVRAIDHLTKALWAVSLARHCIGRGLHPPRATSSRFGTGILRPFSKI